jgi:predicted nucleotide-binding protein (sugar kinase/HSP70/actin superfamily)
VTEDESDFACTQGWKAMEIVDADLQNKGKAILETSRRRTASRC